MQNWKDREDIFGPTIGNKSLHQDIIDNGFGRVSKVWTGKINTSQHNIYIDKRSTHLFLQYVSNYKYVTVRFT